ncbi:MAG: flagellar hook-length control protein FliK [Candidatus Paracaedibacteraceae bacterium]|nr:flagellar hook-length control protein FliK [Candidatus Paracaedibacteraceae bacterium]
MAISETSSVKTTASKLIKPQTNELMESIKTATLKDAKSPFHNLVNDISMAAANHFKDRSQGQMQLKNPIKTKDFDTAETLRPMKFDKKQSSLEIKDNKSTDSISDKPEVKASISDAQELFRDYPAGGLALPSVVPFQEDHLTKNPIAQSVFLTSQDREIQNWIKDGRVTIEQLSVPSALEQNLPLSSEVMSSLNEFNNSSRLEQGTALSFSEEIMTDQLMVSGEIKSEIDKEKSFPTISLEKSSAPERPSPSGGQNTMVPVTQVAAIATSVTQDAEVGSNTLKGKSANTIMAGQSVEGGPAGMRGGKVHKPATLTTLDKFAALNQIKEQLRQGLRKGETHLNIQLKPNDLGKVEIKLDISREGMVSALFKAENRETLEVLNRHSQDFQNLFKEAGLQADSQGMNFSMSQQHQQESFDSNVKGPVIKANQDQLVEIVATAQSRPSGSSSSVDISV